MFEGMEPVEFEHDGTLLRGYAALPDASGPSPAVLVMHSAVGIGHEVNEHAARRHFRKYAWLAGAMVALARRPTIRRAVLNFLRRTPSVFRQLVHWGAT